MRRLLETIRDGRLPGTVGLVALAILTLAGVECLVFLGTRCEAIIRF